MIEVGNDGNRDVRREEIEQIARQIPQQRKKVLGDVSGDLDEEIGDRLYGTDQVRDAGRLQGREIGEEPFELGEEIRPRTLQVGTHLTGRGAEEGLELRGERACVQRSTARKRQAGSG